VFIMDASGHRLSFVPLPIHRLFVWTYITVGVFTRQSKEARLRACALGEPPNPRRTPQLRPVSDTSLLPVSGGPSWY
jgi:hypothetical protein